MKSLHSAERHLENTRLLVFSGQDQISHRRVADIAEFFHSGDVLVVNRSATLPSSFRRHVKRTQAEIEIRLAAFQGPDPTDLTHWQAISFGAGDWRMATEDRGPAPRLAAGDQIWIAENLQAEVVAVQQQRILSLRFISPDLLPALYQHGQAIQYSYHHQPLQIWDQQTIFSGPPISVEPPSAGFAFSWELMFRLRDKGVKILTLLHSAGLSSTGDSNLDQALPLNEWYEIPSETVRAIHSAKSHGHRVVALGTTVLRALESAASTGHLQAGVGISSLKIKPGYRFRVINALVTGMHEPGSSHMQILDALYPMPLIEQGYTEADQLGYRGHEYGDLSFLDCQICV